MGRAWILIAAFALASAAFLPSGAVAKGPTEKDAAKYEEARNLLMSKNFDGAQAIFESLCNKGIEEACKGVEITKQAKAADAADSAQNAEAVRKKAMFDGAVAKSAAKDYEGAYADFSTLCSQQIDLACRNQAAVLMVQTTDVLKSAKRPNGEDCSQASLASDYCRPAFVKSVELLSKICPTTRTDDAFTAACNRRQELQSFIDATDKRLGKSG